MSLIVIKAIQQNERIQEGQCDCYARQQFVFHLLFHHNSIPISCCLGFIKKGSKNKMIMLTVFLPIRFRFRRERFLSTSR